MEDERVERWFGALRSIGTEPLGETRYAWVQRERLRAVRWMLGGAALVTGGLLACWQRLALVGLGQAEIVLSAALVPTIYVGAHAFLKWAPRLRTLMALRVDTRLEGFRGSVPVRQSERDNVMRTLVDSKRLTPGSTHTLAVLSGSGLVLEVDGVLEHFDVTGPIVAVGPARGVAGMSDDRAPGRSALGAAEVRELRSFTKPPPSRRAVSWVVYSLGFAVISTMSVDYAEPSRSTMLTFLGGQLVVVALGYLAFRHADAVALRRRVASDIESGLVRTKRGWMLPATEIVWEVDGRPGLARLQRAPSSQRRAHDGRPETF